MRRALSRFADLLRAEGLRVSAAELIDAGTALALIDVTDRDVMRDVIRITLAKRAHERARLDHAFDRFFVGPAWGTPKKRRRRKPSRTGPSGEPGDGRGLQGEPSPGGSSAAGRTQTAAEESEPPHRAPVARDDPARLRRAAAEGLRGLRRRHIEAARRPARQTRSRRAMVAPVLRAPHRPGDDQRDRKTRFAGTVPVAHATSVPIAQKPFRDRWTDAEDDALAYEVARTLARLRLRRVRRWRRARHGALWVQRLLRENLGHDGVPCRLVRHAPVRREPHLLLLVDVSHSVTRAAATFLTLCLHLARTFRRVRVHVFVDRTVPVPGDLSRLARIGGRQEELMRVIDTLPDLNPLAMSDYGRVFFQVMETELPRLRKDTIVLILGDARTNRFDPAMWTLEAIHDAARRVVWLVPEPVSHWNTGDSALDAYAPHSDGLCEVADLAGLRFALERALR